MMNNVYYDPDKFGLLVVGELEYSTGSYDFDTRVVWIEPKTKRLLTARDSGCSCPTPFEDVGLNDMEDITNEFESFLSSEVKVELLHGQVSLNDLSVLVSKCKLALEGVL